MRGEGLRQPPVAGQVAFGALGMSHHHRDVIFTFATPPQHPDTGQVSGTPALLQPPGLGTSVHNPNPTEGFSQITP